MKLWYRNHALDITTLLVVMGEADRTWVLVTGLVRSNTFYIGLVGVTILVHRIP